MIMKSLVSIITATSIMLSAAPFAAAADDAAKESFYLEYSVIGNEACITGCKGSSDPLVIPDSIDGFTVTSIAENAFEGNSDLHSCVIPDSVKIIGAKAFRACPQLSEISIGSGVSDIGEYAFTACPELSNIDVDKENNIYSNIKGCLFKNGDTLLIYAGSKAAVIPDETILIGKGAFFGKSDISSITFPKNVEFIDDHAFSGCLSLKSIDIPDSVKALGNGCFMSCNALQSVTLGSSLTSVPDNCFHSCSSLKKLSFSDSIISIGSSAFYSCPSLSGIYIPPTVKIISTDAIGKRYDIRSDSSENIADFAITGEIDSAAEVYAKAQGMAFTIKSFSKGDVSGDSRVDSVDASAILKEYSLISSGKNGTFTEQQSIAADWNGDDHIDSVDASAILAKYAELQTL